MVLIHVTRVQIPSGLPRINMEKALKILAVETSCDETAVAVLLVQPDSLTENTGSDIKIGQVEVLSNVVSSQIKLHAEFGGVVPSLAAREHTKNIKSVFEKSLKEAGIKDISEEIDFIAVTRGPGLGPSLLVGISFARTIAWKYDKPLVGVNHMEGHIASNWLSATNGNAKTAPKFPILNLVVSGGHTELVLMKAPGEYEIIGETLDDAVGEAFDKVARLLDLGYPGGPAISKAAEEGNPDTYPLPEPMLKSKNYDFSYAGLKTAALYLIRDLKNADVEITDRVKNDIAASFQKSALEVLVYKTLKAARERKAASVFLSGGVSANKNLRERLEEECAKAGLEYRRPEMEYTTDNAAMIGMAGYFNWLAAGQKPEKFSWDSVEMDANLGF